MKFKTAGTVLQLPNLFALLVIFYVILQTVHFSRIPSAKPIFDLSVKRDHVMRELQRIATQKKEVRWVARFLASFIEHAGWSLVPRRQCYSDARHQPTNLEGPQVEA